VNVPLPGSACLFLVDNVVHLEPEPAILEAMLEGWRRQQSARFLRQSTMVMRHRVPLPLRWCAALCVIRGVPHTGDHPAHRQQRAAAWRTPRMKAVGRTGKDIA
jgi:hypothetical protein